MSALPDGWHDCGATSAALAAELERELGPGHRLFEKRVKPIARRHDCDDALFAIIGAAGVAMVHLTWSGRPEGAAYPWAELYDSFEAWRLFIEAQEPGWHL